MQDLMQAFRMFRHSPGFAATAVLVLTIGIGATTAIFSVVNAVILKPVPFPEPDRLVQLVVTNTERPPSSAGAPATFMHWRQQSDVIEDVAAYRSISVNYTGGDTPQRVVASQVTEAYFRAFGAPIERGRAFTADEDSPGAAQTVVIGHDFWTQRLGGDTAIVGRTLSLSGVPHTVVGIMSAQFDASEFGDADVWVPYQIDPSTTDQGQYFQVAARLKSGVSIEQAQAKLAASTAAYRERFPVAMGANVSFGVVPFQDAVVGNTIDALGTGTRALLWTLFGAVGFVLLIACANVAGLMLVRANGRSREIAIRSALGAGRSRIFRQLLAEGVLLAVVGGALGLLLGFAGMRALLTINAAGLPRLGEAGTLLGLDWRVVGFTVALSLATAVLFSLAPALAASRPDLTAVIKSSSSRHGTGFRLGGARSLLIVAQVGLAVVLLIGASLLIRTFAALTDAHRSRFRRRQRARHAHVARRAEIPKPGCDRRDRREHCGAHPCASRRRSGDRGPLRASASELRNGLRHRRARQWRTAVHERRRHLDQHGRLLRHVRDPGAARPRIRRARRRGRASRSRHQPDARRTLVAGRPRPARGSDVDRGRHRVVSEPGQRAGPTGHRRRRRRSRASFVEQPETDHVSADGAIPRRLARG
jgi:predicted permease